MIASEAVKERVQIPLNPESLSAERIAYLDGLVHQARTAAAVFTQFNQEDVDRIVKAMVLAGLEQAQHLARLAVEETKLGVMEDKVIKNMVASEFVYNYVKDKRTVGIIRNLPERNLVEMAEPIGVLFSLTPITNPTSTVLFKCIMAIKTRNAVVFSPHPKAWHCCAEAVRIMYETALKHGAPEGVFTCLESPTLPDNAYLMKHKDVGLIDATGGPGMVKAAYSSGKPALGVGPGNTPVYLEKTADLNTAVVDIIISKTFDNGTICASEQTVVIDDEIYDEVLKKFADLGAHICSGKETKLLERAVIDPQTGFMQPMAVGQKATDIARFVGLSVKSSTKLLIAPIQGVGREHPLSVEKLFPVLAVYRAKSVGQLPDSRSLRCDWQRRSEESTGHHVWRERSGGLARVSTRPRFVREGAYAGRIPTRCHYQSRRSRHALHPRGAGVPGRARRAVAYHRAVHRSRPSRHVRPRSRRGGVSRRRPIHRPRHPSTQE